jgi:MYXO-CTERM domain-containing protein
MSTSEVRGRRTRRAWSSAPGIAALLVTLVPSSKALGSPEFPVALASDLGLSTVPVCTVCHQTLAGGTGTATKPFAIYMQSRGLVAEDTGSLKNAVAALQAEAAAGVADPKQYLAALEAGEDPNDPAGDGAGPPPPRYGCGAASVARPTPSSEQPLAALAIAALLLVRSRRAERAKAGRSAS